MNATHLFEQPHPNFRNSESFWSSLFAIQILKASSCDGLELEIPVHRYCETAQKWWFEPIESLVVPAHLGFNSAIVEGRLRTGFVPCATENLPMAYNDLRPDIVLKWNNAVSVIETKTLGARITQKDSLYFDLW